MVFAITCLSTHLLTFILFMKETIYDMFVPIRIIDGETRIGIFATRFINRGEQLTYDYQ